MIVAGSMATGKHSVGETAESYILIPRLRETDTQSGWLGILKPQSPTLVIQFPQ